MLDARTVGKLLRRLGMSWVRSRAWIWLFFVQRQHDRMLRRVDVEADDVADPSGGSATGCFAVGSPRGNGRELRIVGQLELPHLMRSQAMAAPDAMHRADADRAGSGDGGRRPVRDFTRRLGQRQRHHALRDRFSQRRNARRARLIDQQPVRARGSVKNLGQPACGSRADWPG